jgi:hypothetical protein
MADTKGKDKEKNDVARDEVLGQDRPADAAPPAGGGSAAGDQDPNAGTIYVTFFDAQTLATLSPDDEPIEMEILKPDGTALREKPVLKKVDPQDKNAPADSTGKPIENVYAADLSGYSLSTFIPTLDDAAEEFEIPCDIPRKSNATAILGALTKPFTSGCLSYQTLATMVNVPAEGETQCTPVPIAANRIEALHTLKFIAYDRCIGDYIKHPEALLNDAKVEVRTVQGPKNSGSQQTPFQSRTFSAVTKNGYAEIAGLPLDTLHEFHITAPERYSCAIPTASRAYVTAGSSHMMIIPFEPCGDFPVRSVIFVPSGCTGNRVKNLSFTVGEGTQTLTEADKGIWTIPKDASGTLKFASVGPTKVFHPPAIKLHKDSPLFFMVEVADEGVSARRRKRFQFTDHEGKGFANREVRLTLPSGLEETVITDQDGWFEAEEGSLASAEDDDLGYAVQAFPLLTTDME